jgi:lysozyme family protein
MSRSDADVASAFDVLVEEIFEAEGGRAPREQERREGGRTIYGIFEGAHPEAWANGPPTKEEAREIYRTEYWDRIKGDELNALSPALALVVFDAAVNHGWMTAGKLLQDLVGAQCDGRIGPATIKRTKTFLARCLIQVRRVEYKRLITQNPAKYGPNKNGWENRMKRLEREIEKL